MSTTAGIGWDSHRLVEGRRLVLGGVTIPHERGLDGYSDADVLAHAIIDALLGAAALGDIGEHFPDTDERFRGADSMKLLRIVVTALATRGLRIVHVDATVVMERPKLAPYRARIMERLSEAGYGNRSVGQLQLTGPAGFGRFAVVMQVAFPLAGLHLIEPWRRGQGVLNVLPLANVKSEVDEAMAVVDLNTPNGATVAAASGA